MILSTLVTALAYAHHSVAMFDLTREEKIRGVVREFQWTNPHVWLQVIVTNSDGTMTEQGFEAGSPNTMIRDGWRKDSFKPGERITVYYGPRRDGTVGGHLFAARITGSSGPWLNFGRPKDDRED